MGVCYAWGVNVGVLLGSHHRLNPTGSAPPELTFFESTSGMIVRYTCGLWVFSRFR